MNASTQWQDRRLKALNRVLAKKPEDGGVAQIDVDEGYLYRPGQLLIGSGAKDELTKMVGAARPVNDICQRFYEQNVDVELWTVPTTLGLPALQRDLAPRVKAKNSHVELNHVFTGEWVYQGGPATEPSQADSLPVPDRINLDSDNPVLAILDTGVTDPAHQLFAQALLDELADDIDELDGDRNHALDSEAGHGTFICGLVQRVAPGLALEQRKVLTANGFGDDLSVALGVAETTSGVLNLSLGGYTRRNSKPHALEAALKSLHPDRVVVAAAGNNGHNRPFWPAAFDDVIAVAAYDSADGKTATFSNYGPWVDVCAPGVDLHSSYVEWPGKRKSVDAPFAGWASWSGTSFAAPLVAAEIARRFAAAPRGTSAKKVAKDFLAELGDLPKDGYGRRYTPATDVRLPVSDA